MVVLRLESVITACHPFNIYTHSAPPPPKWKCLVMPLKGSEQPLPLSSSQRFDETFAQNSMKYITYFMPRYDINESGAFIRCEYDQWLLRKYPSPPPPPLANTQNECCICWSVIGKRCIIYSLYHFVGSVCPRSQLSTGLYQFWKLFELNPFHIKDCPWLQQCHSFLIYFHVF